MRFGRRFAVALGALLATAPGWAGEALSPHDVARLRTVTEVALSPDGRQVAYVLEVPRDPLTDEDGRAWAELHLVDAKGESRAYIAGEVNVSRIAWTPDGELAFLAEREGDETKCLYTIAPDGGEARRRVAHDTDLREYSFSPDGSAVAFLAKKAEDEERKDEAEKGFDREIFEEEWRPVEVWIQDLETDDAEPRRLDLPGSASALSWSPADDRLALALAPTSLIDDHYMRRQVHVVTVDGGEIVSRVEHEAKLGEVAWSPDGRRLAMISGTDVHDPKEGRLFLVDPANGSFTEAVPGYMGHVAAIAWDDSGDLLFLGDEGVETTLNRIPAAGGRHREIAARDAGVWRGLSPARAADAIALPGDSPHHPTEVFLLESPESGSDRPRRLTDSNPWLAERALGEQELVRFHARDGLELEGLLVQPLERDGDEPVPLVMMVHGGPESHHRNGWLTNYSRPAQILAGRGFASFYTNYRGSTGRGVEFSKTSQGDPAGKEFDDLVDAVDHLIEIGLVDCERVGVTGGSYGGYATAWSSTYYTDRFAAGVMFVGISNEISKIGTSDIPNELYLVHQRHWPWDDWKLHLERSPIYYVEQARTPLLILHGKKDTRVFPGQSMELYRFLTTLGRTPVRLVLYPEEGHGNRRAASRLDYTLRLVRWMEHYLNGPGGAPPPKELSYEEPMMEVAE